MFYLMATDTFPPPFLKNWITGQARDDTVFGLGCFISVSGGRF